MNVKEVIKRHGFTQRKVAEQMIGQTGKSVNPSSLAFSIGENGNPTIAFLRQIANIIGANMGEFFEDEVDNHNDNPDLNKEMPEFAGEITMNGKRYGLVELD